MNLKEAFRYQNVLSTWLDEIITYLSYHDNVMKIEQTHLRQKMVKTAEDEVVIVERDRKYPIDNTALIKFALELLNEKDAVSDAINTAKKSAKIDLDSAISNNKKRQRFTHVLSNMLSLKTVDRNTFGTSYTINNEGNQTRYQYDVKEVRSIDFDRNAVRSIYKSLIEKSEAASKDIDELNVNLQVEYVAKYDVSDTLEDLLESFK